ncbi:MAG: 2-dehydro-3-deoxygalactonokinase [Pseudomonadota bacterium]
MSYLLAIDWGTSALRGARMSHEGEVLEERSFPRGILTVAAGEFPSVFQQCFGDWMTEGTLCLMSGMVGSRQGWREAAYCACPAGFADIAGKLEWLVPGSHAIVPGLSYEIEGVPDVMRGEETQIFGALAVLGLQDTRMVHPGTHSKWVTIEAGRIVRFSTFMTGEVFALLRRNSILSKTMPEDDPAPDDAAFDRGVQYALRSPSLLHTAFSARTLALFNRMDAAALPSYLSGLVIGEEIRAQQLAEGESLVVMGSDTLTALYSRALGQRKVAVSCVGGAVNWHGLHAIARTLRP